MNTPAARRFYKTASVADSDAGPIVKLDERALRTPKGAPFTAPTRALAEAMAAEWDAQGEHVIPASMPLTQLAFAAIDHTPARRGELIDYIVKFGETDLVSHRAASPPPLVARQQEIWDPLVQWVGATLGVNLPVVAGVVAAPVAAADLARLRARAERDDFRLTALAQAAGLSGSAIIAFALIEGRLDTASTFAAAALDELWSIETWGEDSEARARLDRQRAEFENIARFVGALV